jgi:transglutaminase-like putative cysteine protease
MSARTEGLGARLGERLAESRWSWLPPAGLALLYHGLAHDRLAGAMLTLASLTFVVWRGLRLDRGGRGWIALLLAGMVLGALQLPLSEPPSGPIGPLPLSLLTGAMLGLLVWFLVSQQPLWLGVTQWVLLALSSNVAVTGPLWGVLWGFILATLVQGGVATRVAQVFAARGGWRTALVAGGALAIALASSQELATRIRALEEPFLAWLQNLMYDPRNVARSSQMRDITLLPRGKMELSPRPVVDLSRNPERLRVQVMDEFDGTYWSTSAPLRQSRRPLEPAVKNRGAGSRLDFLILDEGLDHVPAPAGTSAGFGFNATVDAGGVLTGVGRVRDGTLWFDPQELLPTEQSPGPGPLRLPDRLRQELTPLLREIVPAPTDPAQTARALEAFFQQHFEYSLETDLLTDGGGHHPLTVLIRQRRPAWCVYFASAHAALLRCAGIPARVVGGYLVPEGGPLTGHVVVREQDAHAWVEAWIETEQRWRTFDPTPAGSRVEALGPLEPLGWMNRLGRELQSLARRFALKLRNHPVQTLGQLLGLPALLVLIPLAAWRWRIRRKQALGAQRGALVLSSSDPVLTRARQEFVRSLARWGVNPGPHETEADLLQRLAERPDAPHPRAREFVSHYQRARYLHLAGDDELLRLAQF